MPTRRDLLTTMAALPAASLFARLTRVPAAHAAGRQNMLVVAIGDGPNSMDIHRTGTNRPSYQHAVNLYDRLISYGHKTLPDGSRMYDYATLAPELATSWNVASDGMSVTFALRRDATFWDGSPVTAHDVKWSFDRAVSVGGFPKVQMQAGSLEKPEQFVAVDAHTFRIDLIRKSKLTLPDLGVPVPIIIHSKVAQQHATEKDPWATAYLHKHPAGGGAFMLERWDPGQQTIYKRFDNWKSGPLPAMQRVIIREVPSAATRPDSWIDHLCRVMVTAGVSLPTFFTGLFLVYIFYYMLGWAPSPLGRLDFLYLPPPQVTGFYLIDSLLARDGEVFLAVLKQLILPAVTLGIFALAPLARMTRASMLQVLSSDFIRTARASGLSRRTVLSTYAFRNAILPVLTTLGMVFSFLLGANVLVEKVFAWPGIGSFAIEALVASDYAAVQGFVLSMAILFVWLNLAIDILYTIIDPRVGIEA